MEIFVVCSKCGNNTNYVIEEESLSSDAVLGEVLKIIDSMYADSEHESLRQFEKWFAKGKNYALNELKEKILSI